LTKPKNRHRVFIIQQTMQIMDLSPVNAPSGLDSVAAIGTRVYSSAAPASLSDTVDISAAGRLLSASTLFEAAASTNDFAAVTVATQYFVDAYNNFLQSGILQSSVSGALDLPFVQALSTSLNISGLSAIGISLTTGELTVDYQALQAAFIANPSGTVSLLTQAALYTGQFAAQFTALSAQLNSLSQLPLPAASAVAPAPAASTAATTPAASTQTATTPATATAPSPPSTTVTTVPATTAATAIASTSATPATAATAAQATNVNPPGGPVTVNSADPAVAAAIASYHVVDGIFDMAKPHDKGPAPKTPVYSEIGTITPVQPVMLNLHG
jgi:hypothetical protein